MNTLPDDIFIHIMRFNSHPCADMMNDFLRSYYLAMEFQQMSPDLAFSTADYPTYFEWRRHGIGCEQWADVFQARAEVRRQTCILDRMGNRRLDRFLTLWETERDQLRLFEYHF